jgi:dTDP-4-dehydrorhamnose reductase
VRVLITGREGQLSRCLLDSAVKHPLLHLEAVGRPRLDLEAEETLFRTVSELAPDVIVNAAAYTAVDQAEDEPERAFRVNADGAAKLAAAARAAAIPLIHISTDYVFDGKSSAPYREDHPTSPLNIYGSSKLAGEERVRTEQARHLILRTAWVYSPYGRNFLKTMVALGATRDQVSVVADQYGNPSSAHDLAEGLFRILERWREGNWIGLGRTYHLAGTGIASWADFASRIFEECRRLGISGAEVTPITTADWPTRAARPTYSVLDCTRFETDFGYRMPPWQDSTAVALRAMLQTSPPE